MAEIETEDLPSEDPQVQEAEVEMQTPPALEPVEPDYVPTQVAYRLRAVLRSVTQVVVGALFDWLVTNLPPFHFLVTEMEKQGMDRATVVSSVSAAAFLGGTSVAVWVMNNAKMDKFLTRHLNLGARPRDAYVPEHAFPESESR